ncbi:MAG: HAD family phosphatase [Spirochaetales bacterium]|nr:HAD family phosphatase [Candidatus Physcosoma equi]
MIKAFLFDMDGVLVDSEDISVEVGIDFFRTLGRNLEPSDFLPHLGMGEFRFYDGPAKDHGIAYSYEEASRYFFEHYEEKLLRKGNFILPGAREIFRFAKKAGILTAVASSAPKWKVETHIKALGLDSTLLDLAVSGSDIKRNKPYGDIYQFCLDRFGIQGDEAIVFEDAVGGIQAGKNAGCRVVALSTTLDQDTLEKTEADRILKDLSEFPSFSSRFEFDELLGRS